MHCHLRSQRTVWDSRWRISVLWSRPTQIGPDDWHECILTSAPWPIQMRTRLMNIRVYSCYETTLCNWRASSLRRTFEHSSAKKRLSLITPDELAGSSSPHAFSGSDPDLVLFSRQWPRHPVKFTPSAGVLGRARRMARSRPCWPLA